MASSDDLLDVLKELNDKDAQHPPSNKSDKKATSTSVPETLLEATEHAQTAAELAQVATERALHLGKKQKESIIEMSEALGAWRHATRSALKELKGEPKKSTLMVVLTALLAASTLGGGGFMLYQVKKQVEVGKADILDLMQTQMAVQNQKTQLKLDELASTIEAMQASLKKEMQQLQTQQQAAASITPFTIRVDDAAIVPDSHAAPHPAPQHTPSPPHGGGHAPAHAPAAATQHNDDRHPHTAHAAAPSHVTAHTPHEAAQPPASAAEDARWTQLEAAIKQLQAQLAEYLSQTHHTPAPSAAPASDAAALAEVKHLLKTQQHELKIIRAALWKLRKQQHTAAPHAAASPQALKQLNETVKQLSAQIQALKAQRQQLHKALQALKVQTQTLLKNQSYYYKAPPLEVE